MHPENLFHSINLISQTMNNSMDFTFIGYKCVLKRSFSRDILYCELWHDPPRVPVSIYIGKPNFVKDYDVAIIKIHGKFELETK